MHHPLRLPSNASAPENIRSIVVTLATFHAVRSPSSSPGTEVARKLAAGRGAGIHVWLVVINVYAAC